MNNNKFNDLCTAKLGFREVDITPNKPVETVGFGRKDEMSRGVLKPLLAQISLWKFKDKKYCVVAIDHIGFSKDHANLLRTDIGNILNTKKENVMLCFSHTHSSPNETAEIEYFRFACGQIKHGVKEAIKDMNPVKVGWKNAYGDIGINRRDNCDESNTKIDRRMGILKVTDADSGQLRLLLLRLTAHGNVLKADNYMISPDYFGAVREFLGEKYNCPIMVTQGASGNVSPKYFNSKLDFVIDAQNNKKFVRSETALEDMAKEVYKNVDKVINLIETKNITNLEIYSVYKDFYSEVPTYERALEIAKEAKTQCGIDGTGWLKEVKKIIGEKVEKQIDNIEIQYFVLNNGCLCGVANEIMCEIALSTIENMNNDKFYLGGYTNGCTGYLPTEEEFDEGGYEVYWSMLIYYIYHKRVFPLNRNSATILIETVVQNAQHHLIHS